jgi:hypothetical protein
MTEFESLLGGRQNVRWRLNGSAIDDVNVSSNASPVIFSTAKASSWYASLE